MRASARMPRAVAVRQRRLLLLCGGEVGSAPPEAGVPADAPAPMRPCVESLAVDRQREIKDGAKFEDGDRSPDEGSQRAECTRVRLVGVVGPRRTCILENEATTSGVAALRSLKRRMGVLEVNGRCRRNRYIPPGRPSGS